MTSLGAGERAPFFELPAERGEIWSLSRQLRLGPAMLVFYRGDW